MSPTLKVGIALVVALLIGFVVGFGLGAAGKREFERGQRREKNRAEEAEAALKQQQGQCSQQAKSCKTGKQLISAKEQLLRAALELYANNYGLTSQHLAQARQKLRAASKGLNKRHAAQTLELYERVGQAQTLAMRLDPMARVQIEHILADLQQLPGAR